MKLGVGSQKVLREHGSQLKIFHCTIFWWWQRDLAVCLKASMLHRLSKCPPPRDPTLILRIVKIMRDHGQNNFTLHNKVIFKNMNRVTNQFVCVHVYTYVDIHVFYMWVYVGAPSCGCYTSISDIVFTSYEPCLWNRSLPGTWSLLDRLGWVASKSQEFTGFPPYPTHQKSWDYDHHARFFKCIYLSYFLFMHVYVCVCTQVQRTQNPEERINSSAGIIDCCRASDIWC